jgi:hypothetical protein
MSQPVNNYLKIKAELIFTKKISIKLKIFQNHIMI